jgi:hypothetical protein
MKRKERIEFIKGKDIVGLKNFLLQYESKKFSILNSIDENNDSRRSNLRLCKKMIASIKTRLREICV